MGLGKLKALINDLRAKAINAFTLAGYGGIGVDTPASLSDINATWQTIVDFDTNIISSPRLVGQDFNNDGLFLEVPGVWSINVKVTLEFAEVNAGRKIQLRFFNNDTATGGTPFVFFVGRNQGGANLDITFVGEVADSDAGDLFQIQVNSDTDTFTAVTNEGTVFTATHTSEAQFI